MSRIQDSNTQYPESLVSIPLEQSTNSDRDDKSKNLKPIGIPFYHSTTEFYVEYPTESFLPYCMTMKEYDAFLYELCQETQSAILRKDKKLVRMWFWIFIFSLCFMPITVIFLYRAHKRYSRHYIDLMQRVSYHLYVKNTRFKDRGISFYLAKWNNNEKIVEMNVDTDPTGKYLKEFDIPRDICIAISYDKTIDDLNRITSMQSIDRNITTINDKPKKIYCDSNSTSLTDIVSSNDHDNIDRIDQDYSSDPEA